MKIEKRQIALTTTLLFLVITSFLVLIFATTPFVYKLNDSGLNQSLENEAIRDLNLYFLYVDDLDSKIWSETEIKHMEDVRQIYLVLFLVLILSSIILFRYSSKELVRKSSIPLLITFLSLLIIIPFFIFFWDNIFHPLLFSNRHWVFERSDISNYLFPYSFFRNILILIILIGSFVSIGLRVFTNKTKSVQ